MGKVAKVTAAPLPAEGESVTQELRRIKNGYIVRTSRWGKRSNSTQEVFYATRPRMETAGKPGGKS